MNPVKRKIGFVLAASGHGSLIVNRFDYQRSADRLWGVGGEILEWSLYDPAEIQLLLWLLERRRRHFGDGVVLIDCGANIGVHTVEAAVAMTGWGSVLAIEAQERLFYALAGNIALNNCFNARALHAVIGVEDGDMRVPVPDYLRPGSFGSLELRQRPQNEFIGQTIDYSDAAGQTVRCMKLDSLSLARVDLIKIDIEGMEEEAIAGARRVISRQRPIAIVEFPKSNRDRLIEIFRSAGYYAFQAGRNLVAVHGTDPTLPEFRRRRESPDA